MQIETSYVDVTVAGKVMRTFVAAPADDKRYPGILFYSDIFQLSESTLRWVKLGRTENGSIEVLSGLAPGDTVVVAGGER